MLLAGIISAVALVVFGVALVALKLFQSMDYRAGAAEATKAATEAANTGLAHELETEQKQAEIVTTEVSRDDTVNSLRRGDF